MSNTTQSPRDFFKNLASLSDALKSYTNDIGLDMIAQDLSFKVDEIKKVAMEHLSISHTPRTREQMLAYMFYHVGIVHLKKPLTFTATITSNDDIILPERKRFTDGSHIYHLASEVHCLGGVGRTATFIEGDIRTKTLESPSGTRFLYIPLRVTVDKLTSFKVFVTKHGETEQKEAKYSQNFVDFYSDVSLEFVADNQTQLVILLGNDKGLDISVNDKIEVVYAVTTDAKVVPNNLAIIGTGYNIVVDGFMAKTAYKPLPTDKELGYLIRYGRKSLGDLVLNQDYLNFISYNMPQLIAVKVWQDREQTVETGYDIANINKIFAVYLVKNSLGVIVNNDPIINEEMTKLVHNNNYGRVLAIKSANIVPLSVAIHIEVQAPVDTTLLQDRITKSIAKYYDDLTLKITDSILYSEIFTEVVKMTNDFSLTVGSITKGNFSNRNIYLITPESITLTVSVVS